MPNGTHADSDNGVKQNAGKKKRRYHINTNIDFEIKSPFAKVVLTSVLIVSVLTFMIYQLAVYKNTQTQLKTQTAFLQTVSRSVNVQAFVLREETVLPSAAGGTVVPMTANGSKVGIGDTVAYVFSSQEAAKAVSRLGDLEEQLRYYNAIDAVDSGSLLAGIEIYNANVLSSLLALQKKAAYGNAAGISEEKYEFSENLTKKQIVIGKSVDVSDRIAAIETQTEKIKQYLYGANAVTANAAGYYVNTVDGYENVGDYALAKQLNYDDVNGLLSAEPEKTSFAGVGKLITAFTWYLVCNVPEKDAELLTVGDTARISISGLGGEFKLKISAKNENSNGYVTLVFSGNGMNEEAALLRKADIKIYTEEYTGFAVDRKAIRTVDGETGVYIQLGNVIRFRKIEIEYSDNSLILAKNVAEKDGYLRLYDEVIIEGTELYDGKIIL